MVEEQTPEVVEETTEVVEETEGPSRDEEVGLTEEAAEEPAPLGAAA